MGYTVEFVRVPPEEMEGVGLALLLRSRDRTIVYCNADHIRAELTRSLSEQGTRFSAATVRYDKPVSEPNHVRFERAKPSEMPDGVGPHITYVHGLEAVAYVRADMITLEMALALQEICAEETRYFVRLSVIGGPVPRTAGPASTGRRGSCRRQLADVGGSGTPARGGDSPASDAPSAEEKAERLLSDLFARNWGTDPYEPYGIYGQIRELAPVLQTGGRLVLTRYADCMDVLRHPALGKDDHGFGVRRGEPRSDEAMKRWRRTILFSNPPAHARLRRLIGDVFTPRHVEQLRPRIAATIDHYLGQLESEPVTDFMSAVAVPLPAKVIADVLGIPGDEYERFGEVVRDLVDLFEPLAGSDAVSRAIDAQDVLDGYLSGLLAEKRRHPGPDLLSRLVASRDADRLDDAEMVATSMLLFAAGFETTGNLLGNGLHALLANPAQMDILRQRPGLIPAAVEEMLRYDSPVQLTSRTALQPCAAAGTRLPAGQTVLLVLAAANRDPVQFTDPDRFLVTRDEGSSLSFANGIHFCLGAHLARLEAREFFTHLLRRFTHVELAGPPVRRAGRSLRGYAELPVTVTAR